MKRVRASVLTVLTTVSVAAAVIGPAGAGAAATCPRPGGAGVSAAAAPGSGEVVVSGHGWGHGLGMSQYGAQGAARLGCSYTTILKTYYRGSTLARKSMSAPVRLSLLSGSSRSTLLAETGGVRWSAGGTQPRGTTWQVVRTGTGLAVLDHRGTRRAEVRNGSTLTASHSGVVVRLRSFAAGRTSASSDLRTRYDQARFTGSAAGTTVTEQITAGAGTTAIQKYLWGLAEVPKSWPQHALRAQVVAARTYLVSKYRSDLGVYQILTTTSDQVYRGWPSEQDDRAGNWRRAVDATKGQVLTDGSGRVITAMYSSSMGGYTEDRQYVYGAYGISYLKAVDDSRWDRASDNPYRAWSVGMSRRQLAARLGFSSVTEVVIAKRGSAGRLAGLRVTGVRNGRTTTTTFTGSTVRSRLGLRSPGFTVAVRRVVTPAPKPAPRPAPTAPVTTAAQPLAGDWDGDGRADVGWYAGGTATLRIAGTRRSIAVGAGGTVVVGDWDGDGADGLAVFRAGRWALRDRLTGDAAVRTVSYGRAGDVPVAGRWRSGGPDGIGVVRGGSWHLRTTPTSGVGERSFAWSGSRPVTGDWDGDGTDDPGTRSGNVFRLGTLTGSAVAPLATPAFGSAADAVLAGDWDGDRKATPGVVKGGTFFWRDDLAGGVGTGRTTFLTAP